VELICNFLDFLVDLRLLIVQPLQDLLVGLTPCRMYPKFARQFFLLPDQPL
jgi:hypothetical protein